MWTNEMGPMLSQSYVSDGFMLNLGSVLLRLCKPFTNGAKNPKMLKVNPTYSAVKCVVSDDSRNKNVHLRNVDEETCLVSLGNNTCTQYLPGVKTVTWCFMCYQCGMSRHYQ
jgi:ubiquitin conjugation factor E4 A